MSDTPKAESGGNSGLSGKVKIIAIYALASLGMTMAAANNPRMIQGLVVCIAIFWVVMILISFSLLCGSIRKWSGERFIVSLLLMGMAIFAADRSRDEAVWLANNISWTPHDISALLSSVVETLNHFLRRVLGMS